MFKYVFWGVTRDGGGGGCGYYATCDGGSGGCAYHPTCDGGGRVGAVVTTPLFW